MSEQVRGLAERKLRSIGFWLGTVVVSAVVAIVLLILGEPAADSSSGLRLPPAPGVAVLVALAIVALVLVVCQRGWAGVRDAGAPLAPHLGRALLSVVALVAGVGGAFWYGIYPLNVVSGGVAAMTPVDWAAAAVAVLTFLAGLAPAWLAPTASRMPRAARAAQ